MPVDVNPQLFWCALVMTLAGAVLTLGATALIGFRAFRDRKSWRSKVEGGRAILMQRERSKQTYERQKATVLRARSMGQSPHIIDPLPGDEYSPESIDRKYNKQFQDLVGRTPSSWNYADGMLIPESMALTVTNDQIEELKLPALLLAIGVLVSTAGSVVSLWV